MTKETLQTIYDLAKTLPATSQETTRRLTGEQLMDMGFHAWHGKPVEAATTYCVPVRVATNPIRLLMRIAENKGMDAVLELVHRMRQGRAVNIAA